MTSDPQRSDETTPQRDPSIPRTMTLPVEIKLGTFGVVPGLAAGLTLCDDGATNALACSQRSSCRSSFELPSNPGTRYRWVQVLLCNSTAWEAPPVRMKASTFIVFAAALRAGLSMDMAPPMYGDRYLELIDEEDKDLLNKIQIHRNCGYFHVTCTLQDAWVDIPFWVVEVLLSVIEAKDSHCRITQEG